MDNALNSNRQVWDELAKINYNSPVYDVKGFISGNNSLDEIERALLGNVRGKSILHLQCHFGLDTLSLNRMGATVVGVDFSGVAIKLARKLNDNLTLNATFLQCDVNQLDKHLQDRFDIVFTSFGVLETYESLDSWGRIISHFLKPKGTFYFAELHPVLWIVDSETQSIVNSYFRTNTLLVDDNDAYADSDASVSETAHCWTHSLEEVFSALEKNGLMVKNFKEYDFLGAKRLREVIKKEGRFYLKGLEHVVPMAYSLSATKE